MKTFWSALPWLLAAACTPVAVAAPSSHATVVYSDACESPGGDFAGYRVALTRGPRSIHVVIEFNDDGPDGRDDGRDVKFDQRTGKISFTFRSSQGGKHSFQGTVSKDSLKATVGGDDVTLQAIKKVPSYLPACESDHRF